MRILTSTIASLLMLGTAAGAADMVRPVYKAPIAPAPAPTWTGFYAGINVGGAAAKYSIRAPYFMCGAACLLLLLIVGPKLRTLDEVAVQPEATRVGEAAPAEV